MSKINQYVSEYGLLGLAEIVSNKCFGFPKIIVAYPPKLGQAVRLRLHTSDTMVFGNVFMDEEYSFGLPSSAKVIADAGAYIGLTPIFYAKMFPKARIFAIEPEQSNFELMLKNIRSYPNITPIHAALWGSEGYISIADPLAGAFGNWGFTVNSNPGDVRAITIRSLMRDFGIDHIDLLKIDIEGSEKEVFKACDWQDRLDYIAIELHDRFNPGCSEVVNRALQGFSQTRPQPAISPSIVNGSITQFSGNSAVGNAVPWKSTRAGLAPCAWKSRNRSEISNFSAAPATTR
jgi:FkbM family methyltransferase